MTYKGQVVSSKAGKFFVKTGENEIICSAKGSLKVKTDGILIGDFVEIEDKVIYKVLERKNKLLRPSVSNVDVVVIVTADLPKPDYYLIDKFISNSYLDGIPCIIAVNKTDISNNEFDKIYDNYSSCVDKIFPVSAKTGKGTEEFLQFLKNKTCVFTGQSAVGKTSLVNFLFGENNETGELSEKTLKGKQTTTCSRIFEKNGVKIVDTPGFSALNVDILKRKLSSSYPDFEKYSGFCRFNDCRHINEPHCAVIKAVKEKNVNAERYSRYLEIYKNAKENRDYGKKN